MKPVRIIGGGLAGLALGIALRREGAPVTVTEAGDYPRHRVCGEFLNGAGQETLQSLGLGDILTGAAPNRRTTWFLKDRPIFSRELPVAALGLSRYELDARLADRFRTEGGDLVTRSPARQTPDAPGTVRACGRSGTSTKWIGLKLHCRRLALEGDLAMHLGANGYVGVSRIEGDKVNVCGLFHTRRDLSPGKTAILIEYLRANGITRLAEQLEAAEIDPASISATTNLNFKATPWSAETISIGDSNTAIPPFAGNGMSMAFESAYDTLPFLLSYSRGEKPWAAVREAVRRALGSRFRVRLAAARLLHPLLFHPAGQLPLAWTTSRQLLPFHLLYRLLR